MIKILAVCAIITGLILIIFLLKPQNEVTATSQLSNQSTTAIASSHQQTTATASPTALPNQKKRISAIASTYYKQAQQQGYASLVPAFERGAIANSDMSAEEQQKLCEMTLTMVRVAEIKRLANAGCAAKNAKVGFMSVNNHLKTSDGQIDQAALIEKLDYFHQRNELQTDVTYKLFGIEEKDSIYHRAVAFNLEQVLDYLLAIQAPLPQSNLIHDHLRGMQPNLAMIQKLQGLGYSVDEQSHKIMQSPRFQEKYPVLYQRLQP